MKKTPLYEEHKKLGAKIVPFAGWEMPVQYTGVLEEHHAVRNEAGLFDVSHMGEFRFNGPDALSCLQHLTANDVSKLKDGQAQYSLLLNEKGTVVDDIIVYRNSSTEFLMVVNAGNLDKDWAWVTRHKKGNVQLVNVSDETALIALQGPAALSILKKCSAIPVNNTAPFHFIVGNVGPVKNCWLARTGYTGEDGFEIFCPANVAVTVWQSLLESGRPQGLKPAGLGARDTLRLEARLSLYGHEITEETNPLEAGLGWVVKWDKPDYIGKGALLKTKEKGLTRKIVGFTMVDKGIAREGFPIVEEGQPIGFVTSGAFSPTLEKPIGLAYVPLRYSEIGTQFHIDIRKSLRIAEVVKTPFYRRSHGLPG